MGCLENTDLENTDHRPQTWKTQTSKTQTSQFKTSVNPYTFDENSAYFPYTLWLLACRTLPFFSVVWRLAIAIAIVGLATRTGNSQTQASFVGLGSMIAWWNASVFCMFYLFLKYSLFWNKIKNVGQQRSVPVQLLPVLVTVLFCQAIPEPNTFKRIKQRKKSKVGTPFKAKSYRKSKRHA